MSVNRKNRAMKSEQSLPSKRMLHANLGKPHPTRLNLQLKRTRHFCKTAALAFAWALLSTPLTTLMLLQLAERPGNLLEKFATALPYQSRVILLGGILIGTPLIAVLLSLLALKQVNSAWTPLAGAGYARSALVISTISILCAAALFIAGTL